MITETYTCAYCGKVFSRTSYPSVLHKFKRKYCTQRHAALDVGGTYRPATNRRVDSMGYVELKMVGHPMARGRKWVPEHRWIMAQKLGRNLLRSEQVHHINGVKSDNHIENLMVLSVREHRAIDNVCRGCTVRKKLRLSQQQSRELTQQLQYKLQPDYEPTKFDYMDLIPTSSFWDNLN